MEPPKPAFPDPGPLRGRAGGARSACRSRDQEDSPLFHSGLLAAALSSHKNQAPNPSFKKTYELSCRPPSSSDPGVQAPKASPVRPRVQDPSLLPRQTQERVQALHPSFLGPSPPGPWPLPLTQLSGSLVLFCFKPRSQSRAPSLPCLRSPGGSSPSSLKISRLAPQRPFTHTQGSSSPKLRRPGSRRRRSRRRGFPVKRL